MQRHVLATAVLTLTVAAGAPQVGWSQAAQEGVTKSQPAPATGGHPGDARTGDETKSKGAGGSHGAASTGVTGSEGDKGAAGSGSVEPGSSHPRTGSPSSHGAASSSSNIPDSTREIPNTSRGEPRAGTSENPQR
jgi:hypothetical protein